MNVNNRLQTGLLLLLFSALGLVGYNVYLRETTPPERSYNAFLAALDEGGISKVHVEGHILTAEENSRAASPDVAFAAASNPAAAPLASQVPSPMARSRAMRSCSGSALHPLRAGDVSRCAANTCRGLPREASIDTAPSPWSGQSTPFCSSTLLLLG